jgi:hypothetical protein
VDYTYPERFKTLTDFMDLRFHQLLNIVTTVGGVAVDGLALANASGSLQLLYKEDASSIDVTIPAGLSGVPVVAQNCVAAHSEQSLGTYDAGTHTISLGSTSDWAVAVGQFGAPAEDDAPAETDIYMSLTGSDTTGTGTVSNPYRGLAKVGAVSQALAATGTPVTVYIRGGYYDTHELDVHRGISNELVFSGTEAAPITVRSYPGEWAVFDGINHPSWPRVFGDTSDAYEPYLVQWTGSWVNWEYLEFRNAYGGGARMYGLHNKYRYLVFQNCHANGLRFEGSYNELAYSLFQDCYSASNDGNSANGMMIRFGDTFTDRFPSETSSSFNHVHHNVARHNSDDGFGANTSDEGVWEYNVAFENGIGESGNGEGFKMGFGNTRLTNNIFRYNLSWDNYIGFNTNSSTGVVVHNNTSYDNTAGGFALHQVNNPDTADNEAYNNLSILPSGGEHVYRLLGVTTHENNAGWIGAWRDRPPNLDLGDPQVVSFNWTNGDFLRLGPTSPYLSAGKVITGGSTTLGAIPDGEDFAGGWDWRALVNAYPSHGLGSRTTMSPIAQGTRTKYPGT